ncbi:hypothetical protein ACFGTW_005767, partial [Escherichia coli]
YFFKDIFNGIGYKDDLSDELTEELDEVLFDKFDSDEIILNLPDIEHNGVLYPAKIFRFKKECEEDESLDYHCEGVYQYTDEMKLVDLDTNEKYNVYISYCNDNITSVEVDYKG